MVKAKKALALPTAALVPLLAVVLLAGGNALKAAAAAETKASTPATPSASTFAAELIGVTNQYAKEPATPGGPGTPTASRPTPATTCARIG